MAAANHRQHEGDKEEREDNQNDRKVEDSQIKLNYDPDPVQAVVEPQSSMNDPSPMAKFLEIEQRKQELDLKSRNDE